METKELKQQQNKNKGTMGQKQTNHKKHNEKNKKSKHKGNIKQGNAYSTHTKRNNKKRTCIAYEKKANKIKQNGNEAHTKQKEKESIGAH